MPETGTPVEYSLLPEDRSFASLLPAFLFPYIAYVGLGSLPADLIGTDEAGLLRFGVVALLLTLFRKHYRFGAALTPRLILIALAASLGSFALWVASYRLSLALPWWHARLAGAESARPSSVYWVFRAVNSVLLVPVFEELFCRAYLSELFRELPRDAGGFFGSLSRRMDARPTALAAPPLSAASVIGSTLLFTLGHDVSAWIPAALYFAFTTWLYARTRSFALCVLVHALTNLAIAGAVLQGAAMQFLWF